MDLTDGVPDTLQNTTWPLRCLDLFNLGIHLATAVVGRALPPISRRELIRRFGSKTTTSPCAGRTWQPKRRPQTSAGEELVSGGVPLHVYPSTHAHQLTAGALAVYPPASAATSSAVAHAGPGTTSSMAFSFPSPPLPAGCFLLRPDAQQPGALRARRRPLRGTAPRRPTAGLQPAVGGAERQGSPASSLPTSTSRSVSAASSLRVHRCSRCGGRGHNIRSCPELGERDAREGRGAWYRQRCGVCGNVGHNARNCAARVRAGGRCTVCGGSTRLSCTGCAGVGCITVASAGGGPGRQGLTTPTAGPGRGALRRSPVAAGVLPEMVGDPAQLPAGKSQAAGLHTPAPVPVPTSELDERPAPESLRVAVEKVAGRPASRTSVRLSVRQQKLANAARARVRAEMQQWMTGGDVEELVGARDPPQERHGLAARARTYTEMNSAERSSVLKCARCCGKGYLSCLACAD